MISYSLLRRNTGLIGTIFLFFLPFLTFGQVIKGKLIDDQGNALPGVEIALENTSFVAFTNGSGVFRFYDVQDGTYFLVAKGDYSVTRQEIKIDGADLDLGDVKATSDSNVAVDNQISIISIDDLDQIEDDNSGGISSLLTSSLDPFDRTVAYNLSVLRFRARGYNNEDVEQYLNGMQMNDLDDGRVTWNYWGGLNDVLRVQTNNLNLRASEFSFGGLGGANMIDLRATSQRVQTKLVYSLSNRSYRHRLMLTHSSGLNDKGWAYTFSLSRRWAESGFIEGTHYDARSFFVSIDKKINDKHALNFAYIQAPLRRGKINPTTQEALDLAGSNFYNSNWGYQAGEVRNSREDRINQPIFMLRHDWSLGSKTRVINTVGFQTGKYGNTRLNWYLAPDPRPDYYRKLPYFQDTEVAAQNVAEFFSSDEKNRQLDWDELYRINRSRPGIIENANGQVGNTVSGNLAAYYLEEQRFDSDKFTVNSLWTHDFNTRLVLNGGVKYQYEVSHQFKVIDDLLGADFAVNYDNFALRDFPDDINAIQNDLNSPDRVLQVGDRFGWDYDIVTQNAGGWAQLQYSGKILDVFGSAKAEQVSFYRDGKTRVGRFPDSSFGESEHQSFFTYAGKLGTTYKIDGRNYLYAVGSYRTRAPFSRFAFTSARSRNDLVKDLTTEKILSGEAGYTFRYARLKGRVSGYYTQYQDQIDNSSFYFDDANSFVNYIMRGVDKRHSGIEAGVNYEMANGFGITAAGALGQNIYTSRPKATITIDNSAEQLAQSRTVYLKNYYVPGPQTAANITLSYRSKKYWFVNLSANYADDNYLDVNPERRTVAGVSPIVKSEQPELWNEIISQEKLPSLFTLNLFAGKSWRWRGKYIAFNVSVGNLLNRTDLRTGGFEQFRFDYSGKDVERFQPRLFYSYGRNYSVNFTIAL